MHIAYFVNQYPKVSHTFIRREIAALEARGVQVSRFALRSLADELVDPSDVDELKRTRAILAAGPLEFVRALLRAAVRHPRGCLGALQTALRMGARSHQGRLRHLAYFVEACVLKRWLEAAGAEHVHAHFGTNSAAVAMLAHLLGGPPYSFTVHGPEEFDMPVALSLALKMEQARFVVAISSFCRSQLYRWAEPEVWPRIHVVRCGLEPAYFDTPPTTPTQAASVVCVGRLSPEKGQLLLLDALRRVLDRGIALQLVLAGDGPARAAIEARLDALDLRNRVSITGWVSNGQVRELITQARALVLPTFAEGLPVVIMEAFALGRPVVSSFVAGIPELVEDGTSGWLVPAGDVAALAVALEAVVTCRPERLAAMGAAGRARAFELHNTTTEAARLERHFADALAMRPG